VYVDCTAAGVRPTELRPIFAGDRILLQYVTIGIVPWSAATVGQVEATRDDEAEKNRLCPPLSFDGSVARMLHLAYLGMTGLGVRGAEPDLNAWTESCRLNPAAGAMSRFDEPDIASAFAVMVDQIGPAMNNLATLVVPTPPQRGPATSAQPV
jgi:hypothetical protein